MRRIIGAGDWVLQLLTTGLIFKWQASPPSAYIEPNNKSATTNMDSLRATVDSWEAGGFIQRQETPPHCCNPMTVAVQYNAVLDTTKFRPCIDLSRHVNKEIARSTVKLDDLTVAQELISPGDFMTSLDMENQYFQVRLHPSMERFMGFMVPDKNGTPQYYTFKVMAYGCRPAVTVVTRLLRPIKAFLHTLGIKFSIYIDDGRISASTSGLCSQHMEFTLHVLQLAGWKIQWKKTHLTPTQQLLHLGFVTDSNTMTYSITSAKWTAVQQSLSSALTQAASSTPFSALDAASLLGRLSSLHRSHGSIVRILSRSLQHQLGTHVIAYGWIGAFMISQASQRELTLLTEQLPSFNGAFIPTPHTVSHVYGLQDVLTRTEAILHTSEPVPALFVSDASDTHSFIYLADGTFSYVADFHFNQEEATASSSFRELLALHHALDRDPAIFAAYSSQLIYWQTDNQACVRFLQTGSRHPHIQSKILDIKMKERDLKVRVLPIWTPRSHPRIAAADTGTRFATSTDEWFVDRQSLAAVFRTLTFFPGPNCIDCFASAANAVTDNFYSLIPQQNSLGVDFFANTPQHPDLYLCPPVSQISQAFQRILLLKKKRCLLIVPSWPSAAFWPVLFPAGNKHPSISVSHEFRPTCYSPTPCLFTSANFVFLALLIHT
jgi:hypothetical protein